MANVIVNDESLKDIGNAIREKNGLQTKYKPSEMGQAIRNIPSGGGSGVVNVYKLESMFRYISDNTDVKFLIGIDGVNNNTPLSQAFYYYKGNKIPEIDINEYYPKYYGTSNDPFGFSLDSAFSNAQMIQEIPDTMLQSVLIPNKPVDGISFTPLTTGTIFNNCYSLRRIPDDFLKKQTPFLNMSRSSYVSCFYNCYVLDEIKNIFVRASSDTNMFRSTFQRCNRVKEITFQTDFEISGNWLDSKTLDLSQYVGYTNSKYNILNYNSGITADKEVTDAESYNRLKNDPDWFTTKIEYSRYNHDSAVNTLNSLAKSYKGTIKFKGQSGELTDGGAINTLTEEEIAVATAKGWTVSYI